MYEHKKFNKMGDVLDLVTKAREYARMGSYVDSLQYFRRARGEVEEKVSLCRIKDELAKWNDMLKKVLEEEAIVKKIIAARNSVLDDLVNTKLDPPPQFGDDDETTIVRNDEHIPAVRGARVADRRPVVKAKQPAFGGGARKPAAAPQKALPAVNRQRAAPAAGGARPSNVKRPGAAAPSKKDDKPKAPDPTDNPLVQQIIDMGILVREPNVSWDSIAGLNDVKRLLRQNLVILPMRPDIAKGLLAPWKSVLFYGPPGTGKTFLAKAVATECKRTFFNVTSATITSRFHGESEKLVGHLFVLAEQMAPSTIFFDEIDSVASQRGGAHENEASRRMKAQLLTKMEGIDAASDTSAVFVLAATNFPWDLDEALLRRFQKRVYIPLPDKEGRKAILEMSLKEHAADDFDWDGWATKLEGYSCADVTNLCRDAVQAVFTQELNLLDTQQFVNMPAEEVKPRVSNDDFAVAVSKRKSSVDLKTLSRYEEWRKTKGAE